MGQLTCPSCGANVGINDLECKYCGEKLTPPVSAQPQQSHPTAEPQQVIQQYFYESPASAVNPNWPVKSKTTAGILGILLGGLGIHKFYLGKPGMGILYILFCWTYIPAIAGLVEGIIYLTQSDEKFQLANHVRVV